MGAGGSQMKKEGTGILSFQNRMVGMENVRLPSSRKATFVMQLQSYRVSTTLIISESSYSMTIAVPTKMYGQLNSVEFKGT
jgi:hypothetical protein